VSEDKDYSDHTRMGVFKLIYDAAFSDYKAAYEDGEKAALIHAIWFCCRHGCKMPPWLRIAFLRADYDVKKSWDEVFGSPIPKGAHPHR